jgi:hypothetical protein
MDDDDEEGKKPTRFYHFVTSRRWPEESSIVTE